jgi:hypothetical protein
VRQPQFIDSFIQPVHIAKFVGGGAEHIDVGNGCGIESDGSDVEHGGKFVGTCIEFGRNRSG